MTTPLNRMPAPAVTYWAVPAAGGTWQLMRAEHRGGAYDEEPVPLAPLSAEEALVWLLAAHQLDAGFARLRARGPG